MAYIAKRVNATTARCLSIRGDIVEVSLCLADPPAISYLCVHCPGLVGLTDSGFFDVPTVVAAEGAFVLLEISLSHDHGRRDYLVYKASAGKPQLSCLPNPSPHDISPWEIGILPLGGGGDGNSGFVVAALVPRVESVINKTGPPFDLLLYYSAGGAREWRAVVPQLDDPSCEKKVFSHSSSKVIVVAGGFLGWVDVWRGILLCNVLAEHPVLRLIPLPKPRISRTWKSNPEVVRGIASDGDSQLSFVEIQLPKFPSDDLLPSQYDSTLSDSDSDSDSGTGGPYYPSHGWKATTWKRTLFSPDGDHWSVDCTAGSDDILEGDPTCSALLPQLWDADDGRLSLMNLYSTAPVLSVHDDGVVYMISELLTSDGEEAWVAAFDLRNKRLKALGPFSSKRISSFENCCSPCSFSKYLGAAL
ncbi:unnamed protein product [Urochloa decumbens]|uniref:DUF1618 domain-containing protein n=1 Tax=Urochloa decumbens TaxID=240449 RepID=A0ABC8Y672_9POAL